MAAPKAAKILEVCGVAPPPCSPDSTQKSLPLTFFDILWLRFPPVQRVFFYEISQPSSTFSDLILPKLKHSLSLTLQHFFPLTGTLTWDPNSHEPFICIDERSAISLTVAESDVNFYHISGNNFREAVESHPLLPHLPVSNTQAAVMALQITVFPNSGFSIGITSHHAILDGKTFTMFVKSWAFICRLEHGSSLPPELTPFHDGRAIKDPDGIKTIYLEDWLNENGPDNKSLMVYELKLPNRAIRGTFILTQANIERLRELVYVWQTKKHKHKKLLRISSFVLTCAYLWVCLVKAEELKNNNVYFAFAADSRGRLQPPIPATYFGNCVNPCIVNAKVGDLVAADGVAIAAEAISEAITGLKNGVLRGAEKWRSLHITFQAERVFTVAGSPRFELYNTDFGWGRPRKMEIISIDRTGAIGLSDNRDDAGAVEIGLVLNEQKMEAFASLFAKGLEAPKP